MWASELNALFSYIEAQIDNEEMRKYSGHLHI